MKIDELLGDSVTRESPRVLKRISESDGCANIVWSEAVGAEAVISILSVETSMLI